MSTDFIKSINLNESEQNTYNRLVSNTPLFRNVDKEFSNMSCLFRLSKEQNSKYKDQTTYKTYYYIKDTYPDDLKNVIKSLNEIKDDTHRVELLALKSILMDRLYNDISDVKEMNYEEFMINAGYKIHCVNCYSTQITIENRGKRSADEPTETYYKCQDCNKEFNEKIQLNKLSKQNQ